MKISTILICFPTLLFGYIVNAQQIMHPVTINSDDVSLEQIGDYDLVELKDARYLIEEAYVGLSQLPVKTFTIILPQIQLPLLF